MEHFREVHRPTSVCVGLYHHGLGVGPVDCGGCCGGRHTTTEVWITRLRTRCGGAGKPSFCLCAYLTSWFPADGFLRLCPASRIAKFFLDSRNIDHVRRALGLDVLTNRLHTLLHPRCLLAPAVMRKSRRPRRPLTPLWWSATSSSLECCYICGEAQTAPAQQRYATPQARLEQLLPPTLPPRLWDRSFERVSRARRSLVSCLRPVPDRQLQRLRAQTGRRRLAPHRMAGCEERTRKSIVRGRDVSAADLAWSTIRIRDP